MLRVSFHKYDLCISSFCIICGANFIVENVEAVLRMDDKRLGNVCPECVKRGPRKFSKVLRKQIRKLNDKAKVLEKLSKQEISCPRYEDYLKELPGEKRDIKEKQNDPQEIRQMTMSRMLLIGENVIPKEELEGLTGEQINIFLTEPDPDNWPSVIIHLKKYTDMELDIQTFLKPDEK